MQQQLYAAAAILSFVVVFAIIPWLILKFHRWYESHAINAQAAVLDGLETSFFESPGSVKVIFHTYHGVLMWFTQTEWKFYAPPDVARIALNRLHAYNSRWGALAQGALFIPFVSLLNLWIQRRSVARQERLLLQGESLSPSGTGEVI